MDNLNSIIVDINNIQESYTEIKNYYDNLQQQIQNFNINLDSKYFITSSTDGLNPQEGSVLFKLV